LLEPPHALPPEWDGAWQSQHLGDTMASCASKLSVPRHWRDQTLWTS
jgi:hypothetical protein